MISARMQIPMPARIRFLLVALFALIAQTPVLAASKWMKVQTDEVTVYGDGSERDLVEFAVGYLAFRQSLREFFKPTSTLPPTMVVVFRRQELMAPYVPANPDRNTQLTTFSTEVDGEPLVAVAQGGKRAETLEMTYEFESGWTLRRLGYFLPLWMSQGTGQVFASMQARKGRATIGYGPERLADTWRHNQPLPWKKFFTLSFGSPEYNGPEADGTAQAQSWALMHRVLLDGPGGRERFEALAAKLRESEGLAAVESVLGVSAQALTKDIERHLLRRDATFEFAFDDARLRTSLKAVPVAEPEIRMHFANLLVSAGKAPAADIEFAAAQAAAPESPLVKEWMARRELRRNDTDEAARYYREAIAAGSRSATAYLVSAHLRMNASRSGNADREGGGGGDLETSITEIRRSIQLYPGNPEAYRSLGRAFFLAPNPTEENLAELNRGVVPGLGGGEVQLYRALLSRRLKHPQACIADLRQLIAAPTTGVLNREYAQGLLAEMEKK